MGDNGDNIVRVATYARVSTQEQATEGTSLEFQDSQLASYCQLQGWTIVNNYVDPGFTGKNGNRPGLERLLSDAKLGLFEKVVVCKLDRMARNLHLLLELEMKLRSYQVYLTSIKESIDTSTATGKLVFQMFGMIAEWERETIIERTKNGRLQRYREGCWAGGKPPYGYSYDKDTKKLVINEAEARVVRRIFAKYNSGSSLAAVANMLNDDRVKPRYKSGKGWRPNAVRNILVNPVYKGTLIVNRHLHISDISRVDMSKAICISVAEIVSAQAWEWAQKHLEDHKQVRPMKDEKWLLQGLVTCGLCGLSCATAGHPPYRYYRCRGKLDIRHLDGSPRCASRNVKAEWLEYEVWKRIEEIINDPNRLEPMLRETIESLRSREEDLKARVLPIDGQLKDMEEKKARLADEFVIKNMNPDKFRQIQSDLEKEEARLRSMRANIDPEQLAKLESTQSILRFWESQLKAMAWNPENEDGSRVMVAEKPHKLALNVVGLDDKELTDTLGFPASRRELLDKLQVKVVIFPDRAEVKAVFNISPICYQSYTST